MGRQKIRQLTLNAWSITILVILLIVVFLSWMSYRFLKPFPPRTLIIATGMEGGSYAAFGELYREVLARDGIHVVLRPTSGPLRTCDFSKTGRNRYRRVLSRELWAVSRTHQILCLWAVWLTHRYGSFTGGKIPMTI